MRASLCAFALFFLAGCGRTGALDDLPYVPRDLRIGLVGLEFQAGPSDLLDATAALRSPTATIGVWPNTDDEPRPVGVRVDGVELTSEEPSWIFFTEEPLTWRDEVLVEVYDDDAIALREWITIPEMPTFDRRADRTLAWSAIAPEPPAQQDLALYTLTVTSPTDMILARSEPLEATRGEGRFPELDRYTAVMLRQQILHRDPQVTIGLNRFAE